MIVSFFFQRVSNTVLIWPTDSFSLWLIHLIHNKIKMTNTTKEDYNGLAEKEQREEECYDAWPWVS